MSTTHINLLVFPLADIDKGSDSYSALGIGFTKHSYGKGQSITLSGWGIKRRTSRGSARADILLGWLAGPSVDSTHFRDKTVLFRIQQITFGFCGAVALMQSLIEELFRGVDSHPVQESMNFGG